MNNNVILCGFMASGKTTVGKKFARRKNMTFIDMDKYIEKQENMTVDEIFKNKGEDYFREAEHKASIALSKKKNTVIATGGGALTFKRNVDVLSKTGTIVLIDTPLPFLLKRLANDTTRPIINKPNRNEIIKKLYYQRMPKYKTAADITINGYGTSGRIAKNLVNILSDYNKNKS